MQYVDMTESCIILSSQILPNKDEILLILKLDNFGV